MKRGDTEEVFPFNYNKGANQIYAQLKSKFDTGDIDGNKNISIELKDKTVIQFHVGIDKDKHYFIYQVLGKAYVPKKQLQGHSGHAIEDPLTVLTEKKNPPNTKITVITSKKSVEKLEPAVIEVKGKG